MSLQPIESGTLADANVVMANFQDLQSQITALALRVSALESSQTSANTAISTLQSSVSSLDARVTALEGE